ncbi:MAG TPA: outer membrane beta-barrel protein [Sunxiuqinia sp.]|nr:outer membrane beta-barrel protein [Sunxiuqinia sp.]
MKPFLKLSGLFLLILLLSQPAFSQRKTRLSFTASPSISWMNSDLKGVESGKVAMGFDYGVNADFFFDPNGKYALTTGLLINNTGGNIRYYNSGDIFFANQSFPSGTTFKYQLKYVEIPVAIKLRTSDFRRWSYWGQFGFSNFINIQAKGSSSNDVLDKSNINDEVNLFNLALNMGVGSNFDLGGNNAISLGIIYKNGFIDVTSNKQFDDKTTLNSLVLKLGLVF